MPEIWDEYASSFPVRSNVVYLNHAGVSPLCQPAADAMKQFADEACEYGSFFYERWLAAYEGVRAAAARLIGSTAAEIALVKNTSEGISTVANGMAWQPGDRILVGRHEWGGNLASMRLSAVRAGASIEVIPSDDSGEVDPEALEAMLDKRVRLIALTWMPANGGLINPAAAIGQIARRHGITYFIDAAQAVGQIPVDVAQLGCDVLTGAGRKALRGPRGTGLLYVRQDFLPRLTPAYVDTQTAPLDDDGEPVVRSDAARFESVEVASALRCGLANALQEALDIGVDNIRTRIDAVAQTLRAELAQIDGVAVLDQGRERSGLVAFNVAGIDAREVQRALAAQGVAIGNNGVGYTPFDMNARGLTQIARASVSYLTTEAEIGKLVESLRTLVR